MMLTFKNELQAFPCCKGLFFDHNLWFDICALIYNKINLGHRFSSGPELQAEM